mgnify:CR=1 FL=1
MRKNGRNNIGKERLIMIVICVCNGGFDNDRSLCKGTEAGKE